MLFQAWSRSKAISYKKLSIIAITVLLCILPALEFTTPWDFTRISIQICHFNPPWYFTCTLNLTRTITNDESKISGNTDWTPCFIRHSNGFHYCKKYAKPIYNCSWELMILNTPFIHDFSTNRRKKNWIFFDMKYTINSLTRPVQ